MNIRVASILGLVLVVFVLLYILLSAKPITEHPLLGKPAPMHIFDDAVYRKNSDADYVKGQKLIYFGATWCPSCTKISHLISAIPVPVYIVLFRDNIDLSEELKIMAEVITRDPKMQKAIEWGVKGVPVLFLVDEHENVLWFRQGNITDNLLKKELYPLIQERKEGPK